MSGSKDGPKLGRGICSGDHAGLCPFDRTDTVFCLSRRYLWTDAFAVCNYLELFQRTRDETWSCKINIVMLATSLAPNRFVMT